MSQTAQSHTEQATMSTVTALLRAMLARASKRDRTMLTEALDAFVSANFTKFQRVHRHNTEFMALWNAMRDACEQDTVL